MKPAKLSILWEFFFFFSLILSFFHRFRFVLMKNTLFFFCFLPFFFFSVNSRFTRTHCSLMHTNTLTNALTPIEHKHVQFSVRLYGTSSSEHVMAGRFFFSSFFFFFFSFFLCTPVRFKSTAFFHTLNKSYFVSILVAVLKFVSLFFILFVALENFYAATDIYRVLAIT